MLRAWLGFYGFGVVGLRASGCGVGLGFSFLKFRYLEAE